MMYEIKFTNQFKKALKLCNKHGNNMTMNSYFSC